MEEAAGLLGISVSELEEMSAHEELPLVKVGTSRRLVRVRDVEAALARVKSGGRLRTKREFRAGSVEEAVRRAAEDFGVAPDSLTYKIIERGNPWAVGLRGSDARVLVDLPEGPGPGDRNGAASSAGTGERRPEQPAPREPTAVDLDARGEDDRGGNDEDAGHYYAPEQAARLLGEDVHAVNLRVYRKELPTVDINGYRWIPEEAVQELLRRVPAPRLQDPPRPFLIVRPPDQTGDAAAPLSGVRREITREDTPPPVEPLQQKIAELEEHVKNLQHELRLEKTRQAQRLESELASVSEDPGDFGNGTHNRNRGDGGERDRSMLSTDPAEKSGGSGQDLRQG